MVAKVNGTEIRESDLAMAEEEVGQHPARWRRTPSSDYLVQFMADMILVAKAAEDKKIGDDDDFKRQLAFTRNKLLMEACCRPEARPPSTDAAMQQGL